MDAHEIMDAIRAVDADVEMLEANGDTFFFAGSAPADQRMPFATLVTSDFNDTASDLAREGVFRLNVGVSRETYEAMLGPLPRGPVTGDPVDTGHDYTRVDAVMPHPIYASLAWICVLNPSAATFEVVRPLLDEAFAIAAGRRVRREARD